VNGGDTLYVADAFLDRITLFDSRGAPLATFGSTGADDGRLRGPVGLAIDAAGDVYVSDSGNHRIQRFRRDGTFVEAFGDSGSAPGQLLGPSGIALTAAGQLYVADHGNRRVQQFDWSSSPPRFVAVVGGGALQLQGPTDVAVDGQGFLYVADLLGNEVVQLQPDGQEVRRFRGSGGVGESPSPLGLLVDGPVLHVTDVLNGKVEAFDLNGNLLYDWPAGGMPGPSRMAADSTRRLFVTSGQDRVIFVFQLPLAAAKTTWTDVKQRFR
jgi:DNA-binding beta-propeller fold protein YncE